MIPNQWYAVLESDRVGKRTPIGVTRMGEDLVLFRDASGTVACLRNACPHRGAPLSDGKVIDGNVACPFHGFQFDREGDCKLMPCEGAGARVPAGLAARRYRVTERYGMVWLWWGDERAELPPVPWLEGFDDTPGSATISEEWEGHWARVMETNIDPHHFPFLHHNFAPWLGPRLNGYTAELEGNVLRTKGEYYREDGKWGRTPFRVAMVMPNLMFDNWTSKLRLFAVSTPIDDERTWVATRAYFEYPPTVAAKRALSWLFVRIVKHVVQPPDKKIIAALRPKLTGVGVSKLVASDKPVALFLAHRERLIREASRGGDAASAPQAADSVAVSKRARTRS